MAHPLKIRPLLSADLAFADSLRAVAGWNQTLQDWRRFLAMQPQGCFLAEWDGASAGTATTVGYGGELAWIGMVLVHPEYRRRGIARALVQRCIEYLRGSGVRCIKLDATPEGRSLYQSLRFQDEWAWRRWETDSPPRVPPISRFHLRPWEELDAVRLEQEDIRAFGASRQPLIAALARESEQALTCELTPGTPLGYGLLRRGAVASYLGPVSASSADAGIALVEALMAKAEGRVFWDVSDLNPAAVHWAEANGLKAQRNLTRMWLGDPCPAGNPLQEFALAGPELG